ncbi:MAG: YbhB/YbcL family Raf kinase inhibitor-like protein [Ilumatobacteraceae bacterium]
MLRRLVIPVGLAGVLALAGAACDTGDGRQLREPTASERAAVPTTTSTTVVLPSLPLDVIGDAAGTTVPGIGSTVAPPGVPGSAGVGSVTPTPPTGPPTTLPGTFGLQAPWSTGAPIDVRFTCDGEDRSPLLMWTAPPAGTVELVLMVIDDDAQGFVHWAVAGLPPTAGQVPEGGGGGAQITVGFEGVTGFGTPGYGGPCPPTPGETHTYRFALYALGQQTELPDGYTGDELIAFAASTAIAYADVTGTYTRAA